MSGAKFQLECEGCLCVVLEFTQNGTVSHLTQDFSPFRSVSKLKEDMAGKLPFPVTQQVWKYRGKTLKDDQTLDDVEMEADDVIEVSCKQAAD